MAVFKGSGVAIITPFHEDGSVNYEKLAEILEEQIAEKTDSIIICGTTGEAATLSTEEHINVIGYTVDVVAGRIPVIAGTGANCTREAIELAVHAQKKGADALLQVTPYYNKATQKGLIKHFSAVAAATDLPIIMYNVPSRTGTNITPATAAYLAKNVDNIVGIKEASGNISQVAKLAQLSEGCIDIYSGNDDQIIPIMSLGGLGVISVLANVAPRKTHDMCYAYLEGRFEEALKLQLEAIPLIDALFCEVNPIPVKTAMNLMGKNVGPLHLPMCEMEPQNEEKLRKELVAYGLL